MTSAYWTEVGLDGHEKKVRECKNGCGIVVYWDDQVGDRGRMVQLSDDAVHDCPNYKRTGSTQGNNNQAQNRPHSPQSGNNTNGPVHSDNQHIQKIEEYSLIQVEELKRQTDLLLETKINTSNLDLIAQYLKIIGNSLTTQERILEQILTQIQEREPHVEGPL